MAGIQNWFSSIHLFLIAIAHFISVLCHLHTSHTQIDCEWLFLWNFSVHKCQRIRLKSLNLSKYCVPWNYLFLFFPARYHFLSWSLRWSWSQLKNWKIIKNWGINKPINTHTNAKTHTHTRFSSRFSLISCFFFFSNNNNNHFFIGFHLCNW